jgi:uncharacterized membrane protein YcaP (DUF421 family)
MAKSNIIRNLVQDTPEILIHNGKIAFATIAKLGLTNEELLEAMREHGVEYYKDVKLAMFEIDGSISIISGTDTIKQTQHKRKIHKTLGNLNN